MSEKAPIPEKELNTTQKMRGRLVTHEEGRASIQRLVNSHFHNNNSARVSIPVRADDDDVVACDYAKECSERIGRLEQEIAALKEKIERLSAPESSLRRFLWLNHGHTGMYGDDGEMQCGECVPFGAWDYKREPLDMLVRIANDVRTYLNLETAARAALKAKVARLAAPLSDAEWPNTFGGLTLEDCSMTRSEVNAIIAARAGQKE